jgi:hypothetical protein
MKHSHSSIFNNSEKTQYQFLNTGFSVINQNTSTPKKFNNSLTNMRFPKLLLKTRNKKMLKNNKNKTQYSDVSNYSNNTQKKSFKDSFNIYNFLKKEESNKFLPNLRYDNNNNKNNEKSNDNEIEHQNKSIPLLYSNYQRIKDKLNNYFNYYDSIFNVKTKKTDYTRSLSCDYEKDNRNVIDLFTTRFKQKNDSILNVVRNNEGYYIKGMKYKKYFFFPHKKMNILAFHQNIMSNNINQIKERRKMEIFNKKRNEELKKLKNRSKRKSYLNSDEKFLEDNIFNRSRKRHWTKNYVIRKKMKQKIEEVVDDEINNVLHSLKFK